MIKHLDKPQQITFDITDRCQMQCISCSKWKTIASDVITSELSTEQWKEILIKLKNWLGEGFWFCFSGGEPFLRNDIFELISFAKSLGINVASMSNSFSIESLYEKIIDSGLDSLNLSLNSILNPEIHDKSRGRVGSYIKTIDAIEKLNILKSKNASSLCINISTIILPDNIEELIPLVKYVSKHNLNGINFQLLDDNESFHGYFYKKGCDTQHYKMPEELNNKYKLMSNSAISVIDSLIEMKKEGFSIYNSYSQLYAMKLFFKNPNDILTNINCEVGSTNFAIDPYGDVRLCFNMYPVGNILNDSPEKIWHSKNADLCRKQTSTCKMYCRLLNCNFKDNFYMFNKTFLQKIICKFQKVIKGKI